MKRLIRKAFGVTLYHGTTLENLEEITKMGMIIPQEKSGAGLGHDNESGMSDAVYDRMENEGLDPDEDNETFDKYYQEEYEKEMKKLEGYTFFARTLSSAEEYSESLAYTGEDVVVIEVSLPEDSLLPDDNDCFNCKTWRESYDKVGQVKALGTITSDYIVGTYINGTFYPKLTWQDSLKEGG